jgi:hypothetical protein
MADSPRSKVNTLRGIPFLGIPLASEAYFGPRRHFGFSTGNIWYVSSTHLGGVDDRAHGQDPVIPFKTINYAITRCLPNNGDTIFVMPGHVETVSVAGGLALGVDGVSIIGMGTGESIPTIHFPEDAATTADINITACGITLCHFRILIDQEEVANPVDIDGDRLTLLDIEFDEDNGSSIVGFTVNGDDLVVQGLNYQASSGPGPQTAFQFVNCDYINISHFNIWGTFETAVMEFITSRSTQVNIHDGRFQSISAGDVSSDIFILDSVGGSTGIIGPNLYLALETDADNITEAITGATFQVVDPVYVVNSQGEKAILINWDESVDEA